VEIQDFWPAIAQQSIAGRRPAREPDILRHSVSARHRATRSSHAFLSVIARAIGASIMH
jgi:hypothetical protein